MNGPTNQQTNLHNDNIPGRGDKQLEVLQQRLQSEDMHETLCETHHQAKILTQ